MQKPDADSSFDFRIFETDEFRDGLAALPAQSARFLRRKLSEYVYPQLRREPYFGINIKKLRGYTPDTWRYRIGKYRVFFIVDAKEKIVSVLAVDYRRDAIDEGKEPTSGFTERGYRRVGEP